MIFLTVGSQFPFDRLVEAVDQAVGQNLVHDIVFAQIGNADYKPKNFQAVRVMNKPEFENKIEVASAVISHAGMGTITASLKINKPLLVVPRCSRFGEVVNDHQEILAKAFEAKGHLLAAYDTSQLPDKIAELTSFTPLPRKNSLNNVLKRIDQYIYDEVMI